MIMTLEKVQPQPTYIESSGRWNWPLPERAQFPGCCKSVVTASREWWEYAPSEARPHPMSEAVQLRDGLWYWTIPNLEPVAYMPFGTKTEYGLVPLPHHTGLSYEDSARSIMNRARNFEDYRGTLDERLNELGWIILPVYAVMENKP